MFSDNVWIPVLDKRLKLIPSVKVTLKPFAWLPDACRVVRASGLTGEGTLERERIIYSAAALTGRVFLVRILPGVLT